MPAPISIIVPALNAQDRLPECLASLMPGVEAGLVREVLLVDGGSSDATKTIAEDTGARIITTEPGRGAQLQRGGREARGDWLLFLHADTALSRDWAERARAHIENRPDQAAAFTLVFRSDAPEARWLGRAG